MEGKGRRCICAGLGLVGEKSNLRRQFGSKALGRLYRILTFSSNLLANIEKIATMQLWGHAPQGNYGSFRCSEVHSGAF